MQKSKFAKLWDKYQTREEMFKDIVIHPANKKLIDLGGSCATRLSNAHNRAGYDDMNDAGSGSFSDKSGNRYLMSAPKLAKHLNISLESNVITSMNDLKGKQGYIYFQKNSSSTYQHIDLVKNGVMRGNGAIEPRHFKSKVYFKALD